MPNIVEQIGFNMNDIIELVGFITDVVVLFITTYTFYLTFYSTNIKYVGNHIKRSSFFGNELIIYIDNKTLHTITIRNAYFLYKDEEDELLYAISILKKQDPITVESWHTSKLTTGAFTDIGGIKNYQNLFNRSVLYLETFNGPILVKMKNKVDIHRNKESISAALLRPRTVFRNSYGDVVLSKDIKYALHIYDENNRLDDTIYISKNGVLSKPVFKYSALPPDSMQNVDSILKNLDSLLKNRKYQLVDLCN